MQRRKFLLGAGSLAAAGAAAMGTGAFGSVEATRTVNVELVGDQSAYLGLDETSDYASINDNDLLTLEFDANGNGGSGINMDAVSTFPGVFKMTNNGPNDLDITIDKENLATPNRWQFVSQEEYEEYSGNYPEDNWYPSWDEFGGYETTNASGGGLASGTSTKVSVMIDTRDITDKTTALGGTIRVAVTDVDGPYGSNTDNS